MQSSFKTIFQNKGGIIMAEKHHNWFICPGDAHTNEVVARFAGVGTFGFESESLNAICSDGIRRNLWRTSEQDAWYLWRSRKDLKFEVFNQLGDTGKIKTVHFLFKKDRRSPKKRRNHAKQ